jgi:hypothetical protein
MTAGQPAVDAADGADLLSHETFAVVVRQPAGATVPWLVLGSIEVAGPTLSPHHRPPALSADAMPAPKE